MTDLYPLCTVIRNNNDAFVPRMFHTLNNQMKGQKFMIITNQPFSLRNKCIKLYMELGIPVMTMETLSFLDCKAFKDLVPEQVSKWNIFLIPKSKAKFEVYSNGEIKSVPQVIIATYKLDEVFLNNYGGFNIITKENQIISLGQLHNKLKTIEQNFNLTPKNTVKKYFS